MKLHEIAKSNSGSSFETVEIESYNYGPLKLRVEYDYEGASSTRHGDNASFDEYDPGGVSITKVTLAQSVGDYEDDDTVTKTWPKGTDVEKLNHWDSKIDDKSVEDALYKELDNRDDD